MSRKGRYLAFTALSVALPDIRRRTLTCPRAISSYGGAKTESYSPLRPFSIMKRLIGLRRASLPGLSSPVISSYAASRWSSVRIFPEYLRANLPWGV
jgi:nitric oxide reductase activation protein